MKNTRILLCAIMFSIAWASVADVLAQNAQLSEPVSGYGQHRRELKTVTKKWYATQKADGKWQVVGEAFFKNLGRRSQQIRKIWLEVHTKSGVERRTYMGGDFGEMLIVASRGDNGEFLLKAPGTTIVEPQDEAAILVSNDDLTDEKPLFARVRIQFERRRPANLVTSISEFRAGVRLELPFGFEAEMYWYAGRTAGTYGHWATPFPQPFSNFFFSQRYAVDFVAVSQEGTTSFPSESPNKEDYFAWDKDVKSAERGEVVAIVNYLPDVEIGQVDLYHPAGNYVVIKHAPRIFTIYAHLKQASVFVQTGQKVEKGEVIAKIGNSGNTDEPHLHFHAMDRWDFLGPVVSGFTSQGIPALFWNALVYRNDEIFPLNGNSIGEGDVVVQ